MCLLTNVLPWLLSVGSILCVRIVQAPQVRSVVPECQAMSFFKLPTSALLVIADEVALDYGRMRMRAAGGTGGHNGLKSVQAHLKTMDYNRLKIGVGGECHLWRHIFLRVFFTTM